MRRYLAAASGAAVVAVGCLVDIPDRRVDATRAPDDAATSGPEAANDAAVIVPGESDAATEASTPAIVDLLGGKGDFERSICDPFIAFNGTATIDVTPHGGARSCRTCRQQTGAFTIDAVDLPGPAIGDVYHASAWVRAADSAGGVAVRATLRTFLNKSPNLQKEGPFQVLSTTWTKVEITMTVTSKADLVDTYIQSDPALSGNPCFLVDDYVMWRD